MQAAQGKYKSVTKYNDNRLKKLTSQLKAHTTRKIMAAHNVRGRGTAHYNKTREYLRNKYPTVGFKCENRKVTIITPEILSLTHNESETMQFFNILREISSSKLGISVAFKSLKEISPLCAMLFASTMHSRQIVRGTKHLAPASMAIDAKIVKTLNGIGMFDLVSVVNSDEYALTEVDTDEIPDERYIKICSAQAVDMELSVEAIYKEFTGIQVLQSHSQAIYDAMVEAVTNVTQWANKASSDKIDPRLVKRWWLLVSYNETRKRISIMVYDHGDGIPVTFRKRGLEKLRGTAPEELQKIIPSLKWDDRIAIHLAFEKPRSASDLPYRSKGLKQMRELIDIFDGGSLRVFSNQGFYKYSRDGVNSEPRIESSLKKYDIGGTLVAWEIFETAA